MVLYITKKICLRIYLVKNRKPVWKYYGWNRTATSHYRGLHFEWNLGRFQFGVDIDKFDTIFSLYSATTTEYREKQFGLYHQGFIDAAEFFGVIIGESLEEAMYGMNPEKRRITIRLFLEEMNTRIENF